MMATDGAPASGDVKPDTIPADTERATEMRAEKSVQEEAQEVVQEKQQETPQETSAVEDTPALPPRPPPPAQQERPLPPSHDEKRASLQQPQIVRFAALPAPLHQHPQPLQAYQPGEEAPQLERPFFPRWHKFKIWAMLLSLAVSAVIFGVAVTQGFINAPYMTALEFYPAEVQLGLSGTAAGLAILFCTTENLLICYSTLRRGMHPGWLVTYNLFIVIFGLISVIATGLYISVWFEDFGDYEYPTANPEWFDAAEKSITLQRVLCVFDCLLFAIHFVLLVGACVETHKLNKAKRKTIFIAVPTDGSQPEQVYQYAEPVQVSRLQSGPPPRNVQADGAQLGQGYYEQPQPGRIRWGPPAPRFQQPAPHGPIPPPQVIQYTGYYAPAPQEEPGFVPVVYQQPLQGYYAPPGPSRESSPPIRSSLRTPPPITGASGSGSGQTQ